MNTSSSTLRLLTRQVRAQLSVSTPTSSISKRAIHSVLMAKRKAEVVAETTVETSAKVTKTKRGVSTAAATKVEVNETVTNGVVDGEANGEPNGRSKRARKAINYDEEEPKASAPVKKGRKTTKVVKEEDKEEGVDGIEGEEPKAATPVKKGRKKVVATSTVKEEVVENGFDEEEPEELKPKKRAPKKKAITKGDAAEAPPPAKEETKLKKRVSKKKATAAEDEDGEFEEPTDAAPKRKRTRKVKVEETVETLQVTETSKVETEDAPKKRRRKKGEPKILPTLQEELAAIDAAMADLDLAWLEEPDREPEEGEPPLSPLPESFDSDINPLPYTGRLGYACLNTMLRAQDPPVFCSRTCRLDTLKKVEVGSKVHLETLALQNARDLIRLIEWNERHGIKFLRISSEMFPFASHNDHAYHLDFAADVLAEAGRLAAKYNQRLTMHPGQFTQLATPREEVFKASLREIEYHNEIMDLLKLPEQLDKDAVLIIHMGGVFGDKDTTIARFKENWAKIPWEQKKRIVLENDDVSYSVHDLLPVCKELGIPLVLDWHHHNICHHEDIREGTEDILPLLPEIAETWTKRGITQKMHYSEPEARARGFNRRKHSMLVRKLPPCLGDVDLMIEAKGKEKAVFGIMRRYGLGNLGKEGDGGVGVEVPPEIQGEPTIGPAVNSNGGSSNGNGDLPSGVVGGGDEMEE